MVEEILKILKQMEEDGEDILSLADAYKEFTGEELTEDEIEKAGKLDEKVRSAIKTAYNILSKWKDSLPTDLAKAITLMAKYMAPGKYPYPKPYKKDETLEKAGAKLSKATAAEMIKAIKILQSLLPEDVKKELEEEEKDETLEAKVEKIMAYIAGMEKEEGKEGDDEKGDGEKGDGKKESPEATADLKKTIEKMGARIEHLEKVKGEKKGLEDDGTEEGTKKLKKQEDDGEDKWPSIKI